MNETVKPKRIRIGSVKYLLLSAALISLLSGCGTTKTYTQNTAAGPAKPVNYPIPIYMEDMRIPRPCELIGELSIGDTEFTVSGGSLDGVMTTLMNTAHKKGADVVQIISIKKPDFDSAHYRVDANLFRYADKWETVAISLNEFLTYLRRYQQTLDPIEGVWSDGSPNRIGIIRNTARPGRDFIGFALDATSPVWQKGYKKMDIAQGKRPGTYGIRYYKDDFGMETTTVPLKRGNTLIFIVHSGDEDYEMTLTKIAPPIPAN
jgi:hypothetical protein